MMKSDHKKQRRMLSYDYIRILWNAESARLYHTHLRNRICPVVCDSICGIKDQMPQKDLLFEIDHGDVSANWRLSK